MPIDRNAIVGPVLQDVQRLGLDGREVVIASAYYTSAPLKNLSITARKIRLLLRLDLDSIDDWVSGSIDPVALLQFAQRHEARGARVELFVGPAAHAKVYVGSSGFLGGSANLTTRGFSGTGHEIVWRETSPNAIRDMRNRLQEYAGNLKQIEIPELADYVARNEKTLIKRRRNRKLSTQKESRIIRVDGRPNRLGSYDDFKNWLQDQPEPAANEISERADGKGNLSGHIYRGFYGLRQFLLSRPTILNSFKQENPDNYKLSRDRDTESELSEFVLNEASDEENFLLERWRTYLPVERGGRAANHGGTIGNLNRMLPLVARYLEDRLRRN